MGRSTVLHVSNETDLRRIPNGSNRLQVLARIALYGVALFLPLLFFPGFVDGLEMPKQTLLAVLATFGVLAWLGGMLAARQVSFRGGWFSVLPLGFLLVAFVSSVLSMDPVSSWLGGSDLTLSFLTCAAVLGVFYVATHVAASTRVQFRLIFLLLLSAVVAAGITLLTLFGRMTFLPHGFTTAGSLISLGIFLVTVTFLGSALWIADVQEEGKPLLRGAGGWVFGALLSLLCLLTLLFSLALDLLFLWILTLLASVCTLAFTSLSPRLAARPVRLVVPFLFCIVSVLFLAFPSPMHFSDLPVIVSPNYATSFAVTRDALLEGGVVPMLFGTGAGTFPIAYLTHKPEGINATAFWNTQVEYPASQVLSVIQAFGLLGGVLLFLSFLVIAFRTLSVLVFEQDKEEWGMTFAFAIAWVTLVSAHIFLPSTVTLTGVLALLTGLLASQVFTRVRVADFSRAPRMGLLASFVFVLLAVGCVAGATYAGARLGGDVLFSAAIRADREKAPTKDVVLRLANASAIDPLNIALLKNLAAARLRLVREEIALAGSQPAPEAVQAIQAVAFAAVQTAERASTLAPNDASVWSLRAQIYREFMPFTPGAEDYAASAYQKAIRLDPMNPVLETDLGRVFLAVAVRARTAKESTDPALAAEAESAEKTNLIAAETAFQRAIALKSDYAPAHYFLAAVYEREDRLDEAVEHMDFLLAGRPGDVGLLLQRALLDIRREQFASARTILEKAVAISPTYSNAWWYLSVVAENLGDLFAAKDAAERVLTLNPDNEHAQARVEHFAEPVGPVETLPEPIEEEGGL